MVQDRVIRNDARVLDAAVAAAADDGWAGLTLQATSRRAGLSVRAVQTRADDRDALAGWVWQDRAGPALIEAIASAMSCAGLLDEPGDVDAFCSVLGAMARPGTELRAAAELLIMAQFTSSLADAVARQGGPAVSTWCDPALGPISARRAWLVTLVLGLIAAGRRPGIDHLDLTDELARHFAALHAQVAPTAIEEAELVRPAPTVAFDSGDPILDALLASTLDHVGRVGYEAATTRRIAQSAGVSEATIFQRHATKLSLFVDATSRQLGQVYRVNADYERDLEARVGPSLASAITTRQMLHPGVAEPRAIYLEQVRVSWHDNALLAEEAEVLDEFAAQMRAEHPTWSQAKSDARVHLSYATGLGLPMLPIVLPDAWTLPFDVVTVPLTEAD